MKKFRFGKKSSKKSKSVLSCRCFAGGSVLTSCSDPLVITNSQQQREECVWVCVCVCLGVCVHVCMSVRDKEKEWEFVLGKVIRGARHDFAGLLLKGLSLFFLSLHHTCTHSHMHTRTRTHTLVHTHAHTLVRAHTHALPLPHFKCEFIYLFHRLRFLQPLSRRSIFWKLVRTASKIPVSLVVN